MKVGPKRIAAVLAALAILVLSSFGISNYLKHQNSSVLNVVKRETLELANDSKLGKEYIVPVITQEVELGNLTIPEVIKSIKDPLQQVRISIGIADLLIAQGWYQPDFEIYQSISIADSLLEAYDISKNSSQDPSNYLKEANNFRVALGFASLYNPSKKIEIIAARNAARSGRWVMHILQNQPESFTDIQNLNLALENTLNYKGYSIDEIAKIISILSPFDKSESSAWVQKNYNGDKLLIRGNVDYAFKYNGLFQELAYLYAALGDPEHALQCIDSLLFHNQNYYQNDYEANIDNATNVMGVFYAYHQFDALEKFALGYCIRKKISLPEFYNRTLARSIPDYNASDNYNFYAVTGQTYSNLNLRFCPDDQTQFLFEKMRKAIEISSDQDERNFLLAMAYKNEGSLRSLRKELRGNIESDIELDTLFRRSFTHYSLISPAYLSQVRPVVFSTGTDILNVPLKYFYQYPDYYVPFSTGEPRRFLYLYNSPAFVEFILTNHLIPQIYPNKADFRPFELWLSNYHAYSISRDYFIREAIPYKTLVQLAEQLEKSIGSNVLDMNLIYLHLGNTALLLDGLDSITGYYDKIRPEKVLNAFRFKGMNFLNDYSMEQYAIAIANLYGEGNNTKAQELINVFKNRVNRSSLYGYAAQLIAMKSSNREIAYQLIDSAKAEMKRITNPAVFQPNRHQIAIALMFLDARKFEPEAQKTIKNSTNKFDAFYRFSLAHALNRNLYKAYHEIPGGISDQDKSIFLYMLLLGQTKTSEQNASWKKFEQNVVFVNRFFLPYTNENE